MPESPRWLLMHGRAQEAEFYIEKIEEAIEDAGYEFDEVPPNQNIAVKQSQESYLNKIKYTVKTYPRKSFLSSVLITTQAFFYNAIFLTYGLTLKDFFDIKDNYVAFYIFPFAASNFLGCIVLGRFFDTVGRRKMILFTYTIAAIILFLCGILFVSHIINTPVIMTLFWSGSFFFASAGASAAYLTISEIFPQEVRAIAIGFFYFVGTLIGGVAGPLIYGWIIGKIERIYLFWGYVAAVILMAFGGIIGYLFGFDCEQIILEDISAPINRVQPNRYNSEQASSEEMS